MNGKAGSASFLEIFFDYIDYRYDQNARFIHDYGAQYFHNIQRHEPMLKDINEYKCFQLVRNSYERAACGYILLRKQCHRYKITPPSFITALGDLKVMNKSGGLKNIHYTLQYNDVYSPYAIKQNNIIKLSCMKKHISAINEKYKENFKSTICNPHANFQNFNQKKIIYNDLFVNNQAKKLVEDIYGKDIDTFKFHYPYGKK